MSAHMVGARDILLLCLDALLIAGCSTFPSLPSLEDRPASAAILDTGQTRLGKAVAPLTDAHPGVSGIYSLRDARDAFAARMLVAQAAERTLDVQYYIWRNDITGTLLFDALRRAADRGVRVRLLLDDNNTSGLDPTLAALDAHANIEVRLFNPFVIRAPRALAYLTDFSRANRRMHNKSFTADSQVTIVGGRNVGDEYFGANEDILFVDLDVMAVGPVVDDVSRDFDRYWNSASSYPVDRLLPAADPATMAELAFAAAKLEHSPAAEAYMEAMRNSTFVHELMERKLPLEWAATRVVSDDPSKALGPAPPKALLFERLKKIIGQPVAEVDLVSPYFVPGTVGVEAFSALTEGGVKVRILTNSLEATDVAAVHAGYAKRRKPLLQAGVTLYELRRLSPDAAGTRVAPIKGGSSASSLHAKTFAVDCSHVFVGSFNFDPRSQRLNTEMGLIIESPVLAQRIDTVFKTRVPYDAYEVRLSDHGQLYWIERREDDGTVRYDSEPGTSLWLRAWVSFLSFLPIEWLL